MHVSVAYLRCKRTNGTTTETRFTIHKKKGVSRRLFEGEATAARVKAHTRTGRVRTHADTVAGLAALRLKQGLNTRLTT